MKRCLDVPTMAAAATAASAMVAATAPSLSRPEKMQKKNTVVPTLSLSEPTVRNLALKEAELREITGDAVGQRKAKDEIDDNDNVMFNSGHEPHKNPVPGDDAHAALRAKCTAKIKRCAELRARRPKAPYSTEITDDELFMHLHKQYVDDKTLAVSARCIPAGSNYYATFLCEEKCPHGKVNGEWTRKIQMKCGCPKCQRKKPKTGTTHSHEICCVGASIASLPGNSRIRREWHPTKNAEVGIFQETTGISSNKKVYLWHPHSDDTRDKHSTNCDGHLSYVRVDYITGSKKIGCGFTGSCSTFPKYVCCEAQSLQGKFPELCEDYVETSIKASEVSFGSNKKVWWKCRHCAHAWNTTINSRTAGGNGCSHCASSQRETLMFAILQQLQDDFPGLNMKITPQQKMASQRGDFGVEIKIAGVKKIAKIIVETDGEQHFKAVEPFGGAAQFKIQQARDACKNKYCVDRGLSLFRIGDKVNKNHYRFVMLSLILMAIRTAGSDGTPITRFVVHGKKARRQYTEQLAALPNDEVAALIEF
jgi:very-short-patch-repair endonuclease